MVGGRRGSIGGLAKAIALLSPGRPLDIDDRVLALLKEKHPTRDEQAPTVPAEFLLPPIPEGVIETTLQRMKPTASSGLDRWTPALLLAAMTAVMPAAASAAST